MKAGTLYARHDFRVEVQPDPQCGDDDVLIEVAFNGLCGTDATEYSKGPMMVPLESRHPGSGHVGPTILGHEFVGTVVDAGANARSRVGERVACGAGVSCGRCDRCFEGRTNLCREYYTLGLSTNGGLAEFVAAPSGTCFGIPDGASDKEAALAQPLAVGIHSVNRANVTAGDCIVVLGVGAIGSFICTALRNHDGPVIAVDVDPKRLEVARQLGAAETICVSPDASVSDLRDAVPRTVDVAFEASGVTGAAQKAFSLVRNGGEVTLVGLNKTSEPLNLADIVLREVSMRSTVAHVCASDIPAALKLLVDFPLTEILPTQVISLEAVVHDGLEPLSRGVSSGKVLVDPRDG